MPKGVEVHFERHTDLNNNALKDLKRRKQVRAGKSASRRAAAKAPAA
jgi:hypothetical protein